MMKSNQNANFSKGRKSSMSTLDVVDINYKDVALLKQFVTERGKILPRRITGVSARQQRTITKAIKRARCIALMPFAASEA